MKNKILILILIQMVYAFDPITENIGTTQNMSSENIETSIVLDTTPTPEIQKVKPPYPQQTLLPSQYIDYDYNSETKTIFANGNGGDHSHSAKSVALKSNDEEKRLGMELRQATEKIMNLI